MPVGWTRPRRRVRRLRQPRPRQARDDQRLPARPAVLARQPFDKQLHLGPRHIERPQVHEARQLGRSAHERIVVPPGFAVLPIQLRRAASKALGSGLTSMEEGNHP
jgi:hypothetical protein